jgi:formylglycine-generating enzyme required for sulfatase activity
MSKDHNLDQEFEKRPAVEKAARQTWARLKVRVLLLGAVVGAVLLWRLTLVAIPMPVPAQTVTPTQPPPVFTPTPAAGDMIISEKDGMKLHYVPAGPFMMGANNGELDERPVHEVTLSAFWIDETEVTNRMYALCVAARVCQPPSDQSSNTRQHYYDNMQYVDYPVVHVSWNDAKSYCAWAGRALPSDAQWEKAARWKPSPSGGKGESLTYPWGNDAPQEDLLNYNDNVGDTTRVGLYPKGRSFYGALDMAGNVWEWVADWYSYTYYAGSPASNPPGPVSGEFRVLRGGAWYYNDFNVRSVNRVWEYPFSEKSSIGFRCAFLSP